MDDPHLHQRIRVERLTAEARALLNAVDRFDHVLAADRGHASQGHGLRQDPIANARAQSLLRGNIDPAAQDRLELDHEGSVIQQATASLELHEEIEIAVRASVSARHRADQSDVAGPVACGSP